MFGLSIAQMHLLFILCAFAAFRSISEAAFTEDQLLNLPVGTRFRVTKSPAPIPAKVGPLDESGDLAHLGGFVAKDPKGISNNTFNFLMGGLAVKSIIDVGCGKGVSTNHFHRQGARVLCVEGSHRAVSHTVLPADRVVEHDFALGPWWPEETFDAAWSVEFVEHVGRQHIANYMPIFHKSALIFISGSGFGGSHHVEVKSLLGHTLLFTLRSLVTPCCKVFSPLFSSPSLSTRCMQDGGGSRGWPRRASNTAVICPRKCAKWPWLEETTPAARTRRASSSA